MSKGIYVLLSLTLAAVAPVGHTIVTSANAQEEAVEMTVLADQIRSQGFACNSPTSAERVTAESVPEEPIYLLKCESGAYQIRLVPDQAAVVTKVE